MSRRGREPSAGVRALRIAPLLCGLAIAFTAWAGRSAGASTAQPATPTPLPDLIVDGRTVELSGEHTYRRVVIRNRGRIEIGPYSGTGDSGMLTIEAEWIELDSGSRILANGAGYRGVQRATGEGPGGGEGGPNTLDGAGGGAYGGRGGDGVLDNQAMPGASGGRENGSDCGDDFDRGSAGGAPGTADSPGDNGAGGDGGGALRLVAPTVLISGTIELNGAPGTVVLMDAGGGGAGGGLLIDADRLELSGRVDANGGAGGETDDGGGGGSGGRIKLFHQMGTVSRRLLHVEGGRGDGNGYRNDGGPGSICVSVRTPTPTLTPTEGPTATPTPTSTNTPTSTPEMSATPTPSATASATPTPEPRALYLPLALNERCPASPRQPVALAIVVDASSSMLGQTAAGRTKLAAALAAVRVPVALIDEPDSIALVTFNDGPHLLSGLSSDRDALLGALEGVQVARGSMLDQGIDAGASTLASARADAVRRLVVLSDGLPNPSTPADAIAAADRARAMGILIDTIGLGTDADPVLLAAISSGPGHSFMAPDAEDLRDLFADLAFVPPPCNGVPLWPSGAGPAGLATRQETRRDDAGPDNHIRPSRDGDPALPDAFDRRDQIPAPGVDFARAGDIDGDGDADLVGVEPDSDALRWWANDGIGDTFVSHEISRATRAVRVVSLGDVDNDSDLDLLTLAPENARVGLWLNDGYGAFTETGFSMTALGLGHIEAADLNRDGYADFLAVGYDPASLDWYENVAGIQEREFSRHRIASGSQTGNVIRLDAGDIDGDGLLDFATADQENDRINWWRQVPDPAGVPEFEKATAIGFREQAARDIAIGDLSGDGRPDLVVIRAMPYRAWLWLGTADGFERQPGTLADSPGDKPWRSVDVADMNGDGDLDFLTSEWGGELCWYENEPDTAPTETAETPTATATATPTVATPVTPEPLSIYLPVLLKKH